MIQIYMKHGQINKVVKDTSIETHELVENEDYEIVRLI